MDFRPRVYLTLLVKATLADLSEAGRESVKRFVQWSEANAMTR